MFSSLPALAQDSKGPQANSTVDQKSLTIRSGGKKYCVFSGSVINISKDKSEITLQDTAGRVVVQVNRATTFTFVSSSNWKELKPASFKDVKTGNYLACLGPWDGTNQTWAGWKLDATSCTIRLGET
jgi:hypothetical protein